MRLLDNYTLLGFERDAAGKMAKACLLALVLFCSAVLPTASALHVGSVPCGGIVPIDSQFLLDPLWTISPYMNRVLQESNNTLTITRVDSFSKELKTIIRSESGMEPDSVVVFTLGAGNAVESGTVCSVELSPLAAAADGVTATAGRIVLLRTDSSCPMPLQVNLTSHLMSVTSHLSANSAGVQVIPPSLSFSTNTVQFPLTVDFPSSCQIQILLLLNKEGSIERWYTWIPATVYSAAVTALILPTLFLGKRLHPTVTALLLAVLYVGFLGACIGLIVHLEQWQSTLGRMFPFPRAVTLYCCLPLLYVAYMVILLLRCGRHKSTLFIGLLRLLVYGVNCALCVGYWIAGYVLLGSLSVFQYFATNVVLTLYFVYLVVKFNRPPRKVRETGVVQGGGLRQIRIPTSLSVLWFTPLTPFASCFLFYLDLYLLSGSVASSDGGLRIEDLVRVYNLQLSIPLLFFQNIYGIALLATATAYHMPFVVVLFPSLFLWGLHLIYSVEQYVNEWRRWRERGVGVAAAAGWLSLKKAIEYLTEGDGAYANSYAPYRPKAGPPQGREDARYIQVLANHVEEDIERHGGTLRSRSRSHRSQAYPEGRSIIGVDDEEAIEFPAPPSRREYSARSDTSSLYQPQPPSPPPVSTAYYGNSVFANENIHSNVTSVSRDDQVEETDGSLDPDYWPNSVQR